jgi:cation:H+ antiporter
MAPLIWPWGKFILCTAIIGLAGPALSRYGDIIAQLTGLSRTWIGLILLATATSLPELFTGVSAVTIANAPNIAVGDALGSCIFNLLILVPLELLYREESIYRRVHQGHILTAGFGVMLIGLAGTSILLAHNGYTLSFLHVGASAPIIFVLYAIAMRAAFNYELRGETAGIAVVKHVKISLAGAIVRYLAAALVIVGAGIWLPFIGIEIADAMGWRTTFVGTLFVAGATSLPEFFVTIGAMRIGALDMAIANLLGSNLFDILILAIDDVAFTRGPLFAAASPAHAVTAFAAIFMSGVVIVALIYRPQSRFRGTVGWVGLSLLIVYLLASYALYLHGH